MLTPEDIAKFDQMTGLKTDPTATPTSVSTGSSFANKIRAAAKTVPPVQSTADISRDITTQQVKEAGTGFVEDLKGRASNIADTFKTAIDAGKEGRVVSPKELAVGATKIASEATAPIADAFGRGFKALTDIISNSPELQKLANSKTGNAISDTAKGAGEQAGIIAEPAKKALETWAKEHPAVASIIGNLAKTGLNLSMVVGGGEAKAITSQVGKEAAVVAEKGVQEGVNLASDAMKVAKDVKQKVLPAVSEEEKAKAIVGKIIQGETKDIPAAKRALSDVDASKIKTQKDLYDTLNTKVEAQSNTLDRMLAESPVHNQPILLKNWDKISNIGGRTVSHNYVDDALNQMKEYYSKIKDVESLTKINQLIEKGNTEGLTIKEVNDIARQHGQALSGFNANGELASGLTKQAAENTRTGLKETAREAYGDDAFRALDSSISDTIRTRDLIKDQVEAVNKLQQRIKERTWGEKLGRVAGRVINLVGFNSPKGFIEYFLGRGTGLKTLNALDLEKTLQKNLKSFQKILRNGATEKEIISGLKEIEGNVYKSKTANMIKDAVDSGTESGFVRVPSIKGKASPAEKGTLRDYTDLLSGDYKPDPKTTLQLETDAHSIMEKYNIKSVKNRRAQIKQIAKLL